MCTERKNANNLSLQDPIPALVLGDRMGRGGEEENEFQ